MSKHLMKGIFLNNCYVITDYNFNIQILYKKHKSLKKRNLESTMVDFVQVTTLSMILLMQFCQ